VTNGQNFKNMFKNSGMTIKGDCDCYFVSQC